MTNELEKQFFDTFGIEPITQAVWDSTETKWKNFESWEEYPRITPEILLELICIEFTENPYKCRGYVSNAEELKEYILNQFIHEFENDLYLDKEDIKHQVRTLFEEGKNEML